MIKRRDVHRWNAFNHKSIRLVMAEVEKGGGRRLGTSEGGETWVGWVGED